MSNEQTPADRRFRVGRVAVTRRGKRGTWVADFSRDGRHCRQTLGTANRKAAESKAGVLNGELEAGVFRPAPPPVPLAGAAADFLTHLAARDRSARTLAKYRGVLAGVVAWLGERRVTRLGQLTPGHFDRYQAARRAARHRKTVYTEGVIIKQFTRWAKTRRLSTADPLAEVRLDKPPVERQPCPGPAEVARLLAAAPPALRAPLAVLAYTGLRAGELCRLRPGDVRDGFAHVVNRAGAETKTRRSRAVPVHPRLAAVLGGLPPHVREWLFEEAAGRPLSTKTLHARFVKLAGSLGLPTGRGTGYVVHSLRHFFETRCVNGRVPQVVVDRWMGHRPNGAMGDLYYALDDAQSRTFMAEVKFGGDPGEERT